MRHATDPAAAVALLDPAEGRMVVGLSLRTPAQCLDVWADDLTATYLLRSGKILTLQADVFSDSRSLGVTFSAYFDGDEDLDEVAYIHAAVVEAMPFFATLITEENN